MLSSLLKELICRCRLLLLGLLERCKLAQCSKPFGEFDVVFRLLGDYFYFGQELGLKSSVVLEEVGEESLLFGEFVHIFDHFELLVSNPAAFINSQIGVSNVLASLRVILSSS